MYRDIFGPRIKGLSTHSARWVRKHLPSRGRILLVCLLTALLAGFGAWLLKELIALLSTWLTSGLKEGGVNWQLLVFPALGIVLTGLLQRGVFKRRVTEGTEQLSADVKAKRYTIPHQLVYQPILGCTVTIGMGGSAGAEGPIAYAGAAIGNNSARFLGLDPEICRLMIGIGAGAGIAAIFKAPLAGVFYTLEVLGLQIGTYSVLGLVATCMLSAFITYALSGFTVQVMWAHAQTTFDYAQTPWLLLMGVLIGLYSLWYNGTGGRLGAMWKRMRPRWLANTLAGLGIGVMIWLIPDLFGEGYGALQKVLAGDMASLTDYSPLRGLSPAVAIPLILAVIIAVKGMMVSSTDKGGGIAGTFAPTLFAGCMAGALMAMGASALGCPLPASQIAYLCMAGAMAGIIGAPLMATFITVEVTQTYTLLLPVAIVAFTSYATTQWVTHQWKLKKTI